MKAHPSPFLDVPSSEWVASNRSAFAIRDKYPVTEGHTLIVPRRLISTWWDASPDERADLLALVDEVRESLDRTIRPDGYNVGFNAGAAAGQTVGHLHVHIIPRYHGDMPDPQGGIRHVIPEKGNYLATTAPAPAPPRGRGPTDTLDLTDGVERHLLPFLQEALGDPRYDRIDVVVSFVRRSGVQLVLDDVRDAVERGAQLRLLTTDYLGITEHAALEQLFDLATDYPDDVDIRVFRAGARSFHPKSYIFWSSSDPSAARSFVGSSNLTRSGLSGGIEWNVGTEAVALIRLSFDQLWRDSRSEDLDRQLLDEIEAMPRPVPVEAPGVESPVYHEVVEADADDVEAPIPHQVQKEALTELAMTRDEGQHAGLVVMATGLGKTYLAAFDVAVIDADRVLFIAHREEILQQARDSFRHVLPEASMGLFMAAVRDTHAQMVFASIQSLKNHLHLFAPDAFDYIVVDEFHHAAASSYRHVIEHFEPRFLLGLTATPERLDGASILTLCNDNVVYECDLVEGIRRELLSPFTYHGLTDPTDYAMIPWRNGKFDPEALDMAVATNDRARAVFDGWLERRGSRTLAFCVSTTHADFMAAWFGEQGVRAAAVHSDDSTSAPRRTTVRALEDGELDVLFVVDVFNEGLDVPAIDTVMMLRPTQSPVIFLQQLGRGLRRLEGKDTVTVIDMIGNHDSFLLRPKTLLSMALGRMPTSREVVEAMRSGNFELPVGCSVDFDLAIIDLLDELIRRRESQADLLSEYVRSHLDEEGVRPSQAQAFRSGLNPARTQTKDGWFPFLRRIGALDDAELDALDATGDVLPRFERMLGPATKSYKQVTLRALLAEGALRTGLGIENLTDRARALMLRDPRLLMDVRSSTFSEPEDAELSAWVALWRKNPIQALTSSTAGDPPLFGVEGGSLIPTFTVPDAYGDAFDAMVAELVDYRLAKYLADRPVTTTPGRHRYVLRVSHTGGKPIIRFDRKQAPTLPQGKDILFRADDREYRGDFVKIALNVARRQGESANALPELLRGWFGPSAGHPGTSHRVVAEDRGEYWVLAPERTETNWTAMPLVPTPETRQLDVDSSNTAWLEVARDDIDPAQDRLLFSRDEASRGDLHVVRGGGPGGAWESRARLLPAEFNRLEPHVGTWFRRDAVPELFGEIFNQGNWNNGHVTLEDDTILFVTLRGGEYPNEIQSDDRLLWYSQNSTTPESKKGAEVLEAMQTGRRIHAFCRPGKGEFAYCGLVVPLAHESQKPIRITYRLLTPLTTRLLGELGSA